MARRQAIKSAERNVTHLGKLFASLGTKEHPRGKILSAYRQAHRALRDVLRREAYGEVREVMAFLEADVSTAARDALEIAGAIGRTSAERQLGAYDVEAAIEVVEDPGIALMHDAWMNQVRDQSTRSQALLLGGGDPVLVIGDQARQGIVRAAPVISEGTRWLAMAAALTWEGIVSRSAERAGVTFMRQAVAAIDERTTDTCLQVHGQVVRMEERFHLTGTPRFADYMKDPPFHYNCRTSQVLVKPEERNDELTQAMVEAASVEESRRVKEEPPGEGPVSALGRG